MAFYGRFLLPGSFFRGTPAYELEELNWFVKKVVFVAFAIEDETQRGFLKGQPLNTRPNAKRNFQKDR